ncbi:ImmA/IrrE family metallo-endopeptidase [Thalassolituus sp. C2-1]|uniref:ImmA/IrrE family metallo-endopeptidase n=1 Tax=Venatorbacter sp. C2-1 TaxID=2597518 RepID=UPI001191AB03|nr:ImmA/IrrE family metallo-endopeptidase [Thalassolituus sp. C2-1]TVV41851.1 ImmA/IrrE family metallo-endopeptidase [Thalassolituus sp. C2-1]
MTQTPDCKKFAIQLANVWIATHPTKPFPVNCKEIAEEYGIKVVSEVFPDDFQACLVIENNLKAIIYNDAIKEQGRINFTIAHELGHFSLHKDQQQLRCSIDDLQNFGDLAPHGQDIEREANLFAATLLMPGKDIRQRIHKQVLSLPLIQDLHNLYETSMTATACRAVEKHNLPAAVIMLSSNQKVLWSYRNSYFPHFFVRKGQLINLSNNSYASAADWGGSEFEFPVHQAVIEMPAYKSILVVLSRMPTF